MGRLDGRVAALALVITAIAPGGARAHGDLHGQIADLDARLAAAPDQAALYVRRGDLHRAHRDWRAALADYDRAGDLDPRLAGPDLGRAAVWLETDAPAAALAAADRVLARAPEHSEGRRLRARSLLALLRPAEAAEEWGRLIAETAKPRPEHYAERARALAAAGDAHLAEAVATLDEGIRRLGPLVTLDLLAIELELRLGRSDAALSRVERQSEATPRKEGWLLRRGEILEQAGRPAEARQAFAGSLAALAALPPGRRQTRAIEELRQRSEAALARTADRAKGDR